jgi:aminoglycoside phosphotransferase family enzyme/predicted kinase
MGIVKRSDADAQPELVRALLDPRAYPGAQGVEHLETHISHVFLTGAHAYKIKKPLDLGFLDFSTLEQRRRFCEEELRINRRLAPDLYLAVVPISGSASAPSVEGTGAPIEYAVKMRQFPQEGLLERVLQRGELAPGLIDALAEEVADFHAAIPLAAGGSEFGSAGSIVAPARQNFEQLAPLLRDEGDRRALERLAAWTDWQSERLAACFEQRQRDGFVRECHGDLHLANMVLLDGKVRIFDAIEFNPGLRWIDVINEVAFVCMDLAARGREDLGGRFLNAYLERTGDYAGMRVLRYYVAYRALVRAKIAAMRATQADVGAVERDALLAKCRLHLALALRVAQQAHPTLVIHHGLSGSGKTWCSQTILETIGAVRVRSDVERKRLHGLAASARTGASVGGGIYAASHDTYARLAALAEEVLAGGYPVLVDATFLKREQRDAFRDLAGRLDVPFRIAHFFARPQTLMTRVAARAAGGADASEEGHEVLQAQLRTQEPLAADEEPAVVRFDTERLSQDDIRALAHALVEGAPAPASPAPST